MTDYLSTNISYDDYITLFYAEMTDTRVDVHTTDAIWFAASVWRIADDDLTFVHGDEKITIPFAEIMKITQAD